MDKRFDAKRREPALYAAWEAADVFAAKPESGRTPYVIVMPPPNVTGSLHAGHALTMTLQDVLIRRKRQEGYDALWQPGTDHAGIATQMMVERELAARGEGLSRRELGREKFLAEAWRWKEESEAQILSQLKALGASPDWSRLCFTLDPGVSAAVRRVFVALHREGLIYRAERLVNWDPVLETAVSDLEVQPRETEGRLWSLRYPLVAEEGRAGGESAFITVATTRPETFFGDTAVAVHPDDERMQGFIGRRVRLPFVGREIPVVADAAVAAETGSGALKVTPAHDFTDFEIGERHGLARINIMDERARLLAGPVPAPFAGMEREAAREAVAAAFEAEGLLAGVRPIVHAVPHGDRSGAALEPRLTEQWFCDAAPLAEAASKAVAEGRTEFVPARWRKTYDEWMNNIRPWCLSRQLWWGHRIPAWSGPDGEIFVAESEEEARRLAAERYGKDEPLVQDEDVLDTWFSSALWPFTTLGWNGHAPDDKTARDLARYYPGDVLVTGFDIIFFWVARMMMMGLKAAGDVPFRRVYIHALVRDAKGRKMSKTKGNVVDPLALVDEHGADAVRFALAGMATPGRNVNLDPARFQACRNFTTKLWNAARFALLNRVRRSEARNFVPPAEPHNAWIVLRCEAALQALAGDFEAYRFDDAVARLQKLVWHELCDWYLELAKDALLAGAGEGAGEGAGGEGGGAAASVQETRATLAFALERCLIGLHPVIPFVTEEIWAAFTAGEEGGKSAGLLAEEAAPEPLGAEVLSKLGQTAAPLEWHLDLVAAVRARRAELRVPQGAKLRLEAGPGAPPFAELGPAGPGVLRLGGLESVVPLAAEGGSGAERGAAISWSQAGAEVRLHLGASVDLEAEAGRLAGEEKKLLRECEQLDKRLADEGFLRSAPEEVVEEKRARLAKAQAALEQTRAIAARLQGAL